MDIKEAHKLSIGTRITYNGDKGIITETDREDDEFPVFIRFDNDTSAWVTPSDLEREISAPFTVSIPFSGALQCENGDVSFELYQLLDRAGFIVDESPTEQLTELIGSQQVAEIIVSECTENTVRNIYWEASVNKTALIEAIDHQLTILGSERKTLQTSSRKSEIDGATDALLWVRRCALLGIVV